MTAGNGNGDGGVVAAVLRLTDLAARAEHADQRISSLARDCADAIGQIAGLREELGGRADKLEARLAEVSGLLDRISGQIKSLTSEDQPKEARPGYQVNPAPPWWKPSDARCEDTAVRLRDWVAEVYRPVFGYLAGLLAPCWDRHPLCLTYMDTLHEAWCLLYLGERDPKMVFAQLDWLTRPLLQAADVMSAETRGCRDRGQHRDPGRPAPATPGLADRRI